MKALNQDKNKYILDADDNSQVLRFSSIYAATSIIFLGRNKSLNNMLIAKSSKLLDIESYIWAFFRWVCMSANFTLILKLIFMLVS